MGASCPFGGHSAIRRCARREYCPDPMAKGDSGGVPWQCLVSLRTSPAALVPVSGCWVRAITNHTVAVIARTFLYGSEGSEGSIDGTIEPPEPRTDADHLRRGRGGRRARRRPRARRR